MTLDVCLTFSFDLVTSRTETGTVVQTSEFIIVETKQANRLGQPPISHSQRAAANGRAKT